MKTLTRIALVMLVIAVAACGPPASRLKVHVEHDEQIRIERFRTYAWQDGTRVKSEESHQFLLSSIEEELAELGWQKSDSPDIHVMYHASVTRERELTSYTELSRSSGFHQPRPTFIMKGQLIVEMVDAERKEIFWRGTATEVLSEASSNEERTRNAIVALFVNYPDGPAEQTGK